MDISVLFVPSESIKIIFVFGDWGLILGVFHNQIPFVHELSLDDIWKPLPGEDELLSFLDTTSKGKTYYYKVRSVVLSDDKSVYSSYSSVKKIKSK